MLKEALHSKPYQTFLSIVGKLCLNFKFHPEGFFLFTPPNLLPEKCPFIYAIALVHCPQSLTFVLAQFSCIIPKATASISYKIGMLHASIENYKISSLYVDQLLLIL